MTRSKTDRSISLLFDVFVVNQRLRTLLTHALIDSELRPDEYAVYSLLFEGGALTPTEMAARMAMPLTTVLDYLRAMSTRGHVKRVKNAADARSYRVSLTIKGVSAHRRTNAQWNNAVRRLEGALEKPVAEVRDALHALDDAAATAVDALLIEERKATG